MYKFKKILLVDDDPITIIICEKIISHVNFAEKIVSAKNGKEGIDYIKQVLSESPEELPDIVFLDLNMPVMNGWDFLDEYSTLALPALKQPVICILSSTIDNQDEEKAFKYHVVSRFISKPLTKEILQGIDSK